MANQKTEQAKQAEKPPEKKPAPLKWFFIFWGAVLLIVVIAVAAFGLNPLALLVWLIVVAISFIFMMAQLLQEWEGTVQEIKTVAESHKDSHGDYHKENVTYAFIKLTNGKTKKVRSGGWKVGDHLKKVKWEYQVRVL